MGYISTGAATSGFYPILAAVLFIYLFGGLYMGRFKDKFKPDIFCDDVYTLDIECLKKIGIKALIFDIDNTLVTYDDLKAPEHTKNGLKCCIKIIF